MTDKELYHALRVLPSLSPSKEVNALFSSLITFAESGQKINLSQEEIKELQKIRSRNESEVEFFYTKKILMATNKEKALEDFLYFQKYVEFGELEYQNLISCAHGEKVESVVFIGGGALPLTAILLAKEKGVRVTILEKDEVAATLGREIVNSLSLSSLVTVTLCDALSFTEYNEFDAVYVAALVGEGDEEKEAIISHVYKHMKEKSLLLLRSSFGSYKLLYAPVREEFLLHYPVLLEVRPYKNICNSFFIIQKT
jgi:nicotianamine synthase